MSTYHFVFAQQSAWGTWVTPSMGMPVDNFKADVGREYIDRRTTGSNRGLRAKIAGKKLPTGSLSLSVFEERMGYFVKACGLTGVNSAALGATSAYEHNFVPDDSAANHGLSVQVQHDGTHAQNFLGLVGNRVTFNFSAGEVLMLNVDWLAKDEALTGGNWDNGSSAPALVASPSYFASSVLPLSFCKAHLYVGGTVSYDSATKKYTVSGGTEYAVETAEVTLENNYDPRVFLGSCVAGNNVGQDRAVSVRFDMDFSAWQDAMYTYYREGTPAALQIVATGGVADTGYNYTFEITIPSVVFTSGSLPDVTGSNERRLQSVEGNGVLDDNDNDIGIRIIDTQTSY